MFQNTDNIRMCLLSPDKLSTQWTPSVIKKFQENYSRTVFILMDMLINIHQEFIHCFEKAEQSWE